jgi:hypothetical protein
MQQATKTNILLNRYLFWAIVLLIPTGFAMGYMLALPPQPTCPSTVDPGLVETSNEYYQSNKTVNPLGLSYITIKKSDYEAMKCYLVQYPNTTHFRIYMGMESKGGLFTYIGGKVDGTVNTTTYFRASSGVPDLCPPVCDIPDPMTPAVYQ